METISKAKPKPKMRNGVMKRGTGENPWSYVTYYTDASSGKRKQIWVSGFKSESDARKARHIAESDKARGRFINPHAMTFAELLTEWLEFKRHQIKPNTFEIYEVNVRKLIPRIGSLRLQEIKRADIEKLFRELSQNGSERGTAVSANYVKLIGKSVRESLTWAVKRDYIIKNPSLDVPYPKNYKKTPEPFSREEIEIFFTEASAHRLYFLYFLSANTGARVGELIALRWADFDGKKLEISKTRTRVGKSVIEHSPKTARGIRSVHLSEEVIEEFSTHRRRQIAERLAHLDWQDSDYIFTQDDGRPLEPSTASNIFAKLVRRSGLRHTRLHDLRHHHITQLLSAGIQPHVVAKRVGDTVAVILETYAHTSEEDLKSASEVYSSGRKNVG